MIVMREGETVWSQECILDRPAALTGVSRATAQRILTKHH